MAKLQATGVTAGHYEYDPYGNAIRADDLLSTDMDTQDLESSRPLRGVWWKTESGTTQSKWFGLLLLEDQRSSHLGRSWTRGRGPAIGPWSLAI